MRTRALARDRARARVLPHVRVSACACSRACARAHQVHVSVASVGRLCMFACARARACLRARAYTHVRVRVSYSDPQSWVSVSYLTYSKKSNIGEKLVATIKFKSGVSAVLPYRIRFQIRSRLCFCYFFVVLETAFNSAKKQRQRAWCKSGFVDPDTVLKPACLNKLQLSIW